MSPLPLRDPRYRPPLTAAGRWGSVVHAGAALAGWALFGLFWKVVFLRTPAAESAAGVLAVAALLVVCVSVTGAWIRHNLLLARRYAWRRVRVREVERDWSRDALGRPVRGPSWEVLQAAAEVEVDLDPHTGAKVYRAF